jgi:hypothetical protein
MGKDRDITHLLPPQGPGSHSFPSHHLAKISKKFLELLPEHGSIQIFIGSDGNVNISVPPRQGRWLRGIACRSEAFHEQGEGFSARYTLYR